MPAQSPAAEWVAITDLTPWESNPRKNDQAVEDVAKSIKRFGFAAPIVARLEDSKVIAGHTRLKAALKLGLDKVPVRYVDLSESEAHALSLADNKVGELADWDDNALREILASLDAHGTDISGLGWSDSDLEDLVVSFPGEDWPEPKEGSAYDHRVEIELSSARLDEIRVILKEWGDLPDVEINIQ